MRTEPIQRGAKCPQGRPPHALLRVLVRLAALAGFAFAGWLALSAPAHSAVAGEQPAKPAGGPGTAQSDPGLIGRAPRVGGLDAVSTLRHLTTAPA
ncbi:hypothetical protein GWI34_29810, partial [Actinomadura sp. DSM 109109]|nr:hypothetical protein [Actinomadura lepetitiana]